MTTLSKDAFMELFEVQHELSRSQYAETFLLQRKDNAYEQQQTYVTKCFHKSKITDVSAFLNKLTMIQSFNFTFLVPYDFIVDDDEQIFLVRKFVSAQPLSALDPAEFNMALTWRRILQAFATLHDHSLGGIFVKPDNIFANTNGVIMLVDLYPIPSPPFNGADTPDLKFFQFLAPEFFTNESPISEKSDIWSLGAIMLVSYGYSLPWSASNIFGMINKITTHQIELPDSIPTKLKDMLTQMLVRDSSFRSPISKIIRSQTRSSGTPAFDLIVKPKRNSDSQVQKISALINPMAFKNARVSVNTRSAKLPPLPSAQMISRYKASIQVPHSSLTRRPSSRQMENRKIVDNLFSFAEYI
ncbi:hypothetical protein TRFO_41515 [Tritrichomonas foetus]|uniref:Protein kinase domain-containing protein n=1 Tax=Tritrichomonas foetus TaxID=1144522 RepID=A0A1J4L069_9EUKA|nr:hypothetical protein TRFO_41515 [Tritrichomonas foetus]|eukprot:OHT16867.1 hypothetical protein TRFO_41515 [Tritrichomonas foetus]